MPIKLIALDIDGTLLDGHSNIPGANLRAIQAATEQDIAIILVTGRRFDFALPIAQQIPCPLTMIVNNGALVKSREGVRYVRRLLPQETARQVLERMTQYRHSAAIVFDWPRTNQVIFESIDWQDPLRKDYYLRNRGFIAQSSPLQEALTDDPIQVMYSGPVQEMRYAEAQLRLLQAVASFSLAVTYYDSRDFGLIDVIQENCSKGAALAEWTARLGFTREEVMVIGDNLNDREMLEFAGLPIVMGNCVPELKGLSYRQTLSNDDAGVAAAIEAYALRGSRNPGACQLK